MLRPSHPVTVIIEGVPVYGGGDPVKGMVTFEADTLIAAARKATDEQFHMRYESAKHTTPGNEDRPVIEAHAVYPDKTLFIGALYGVEWELWEGRYGL